MTSSIVTAVTEVFGAMGDWFIEFVPGITNLFYNAESGLTMIGVLALCGLGISVTLLVLNLVRSFIQFA